MKQIKIHIKRHLAKTFSYGIFDTIITFVFFYILTNNFLVSLYSGLIKMVITFLTYFSHEKIWHRWINYGIYQEKIKKREFPIKQKPIVSQYIKPIIKEDIVEDIKPIPIDDIPIPHPVTPIIPKDTIKRLNYSSNR